MLTGLQRKNKADECVTVCDHVSESDERIMSLRQVWVCMCVCDAFRCNDARWEVQASKSDILERKKKNSFWLFLVNADTTGASYFKEEEAYVHMNRNEINVTYDSYPFIDVVYSVYQVCFSAKTDEGSAHVEIRKISIMSVRCAVYCGTVLWMEWNDNYCKQSTLAITYLHLLTNHRGKWKDIFWLQWQSGKSMQSI